MPEEETRSEDSGWLLEPAAGGEVHLKIAVGSEVELSPEARAALEALMSALHDDEVVGFLPPCPELRGCGRFTCWPLGKCTELSSSPCLADVTCKVAEFM